MQFSVAIAVTTVAILSHGEVIGNVLREGKPVGRDIVWQRAVEVDFMMAGTERSHQQIVTRVHRGTIGPRGKSKHIVVRQGHVEQRRLRAIALQPLPV